MLPPGGLYCMAWGSKNCGSFSGKFLWFVTLMMMMMMMFPRRSLWVWGQNRIWGGSTTYVCQIVSLCHISCMWIQIQCPCLSKWSHIYMPKMRKKTCRKCPSCSVAKNSSISSSHPQNFYSYGPGLTVITGMSYNYNHSYNYKVISCYISWNNPNFSVLVGP